MQFKKLAPSVALPFIVRKKQNHDKMTQRGQPQAAAAASLDAVFKS